MDRTKLPVWILSHSTSVADLAAVFFWQDVLQGATVAPPVYGIVPLFSTRAAAEAQAAKMFNRPNSIECQTAEELAAVLLSAAARNATDLAIDPGEVIKGEDLIPLEHVDCG